MRIALVCTLLVFVLSFQQGVYSHMTETTLRVFDGDAQLQPPGYADDPALDRVIADPYGLALREESLEGVTAAPPRINAFAVLVSGERSYAAAVIGIDPAAKRGSPPCPPALPQAATSPRGTAMRPCWAMCSPAISA
jgi:ABC-type lipoprotein release transport system permease subunit